MTTQGVLGTIYLTVIKWRLLYYSVVMHSLLTDIHKRQMLHICHEGEGYSEVLIAMDGSSRFGMISVGVDKISLNSN